MNPTADMAWRAPALLPAPTLRRLARLDTGRGLLALAGQWAVIAATVAFCEAWWSLPLYLAAVLVIGGRQIALMLIAHEAVHNMLLRNRLWNDRLAEWFAAWPVLMPYRSYRRIHRQHHLYLGTEKDPDFARNRPDRLVAGGGLASLLRLLLGFERRQLEVRHFWGPGDPEAEREGFRARPMVRAGAYLAVVAAAVACGAFELLLLYWIVPLGWFLVGMRLKGIAEHFAVPGRSPLDQSRTLEASWPARLLVIPLNAAYHVEHHLYPAVPHYRLPELHRSLLEVPAFAGGAHRTSGYLGFLAECMRLGEAPARSASG